MVTVTTCTSDDRRLSLSNERTVLPPAKKRCEDNAKAYNKERSAKIQEYNKQLKAYNVAKKAAEDAERINQERKTQYDANMESYYRSVDRYYANIAHDQMNLPIRIAAWEEEKTQIYNNWENQKSQIDTKHGNDIEEYKQQKANIDSAHQDALANWEEQKVNIDNAHQQAVNSHAQQVIAHQQDWLKQLDDHDKAMQQYNDDLATAPSVVVSVDDAKTLLAHNPFQVTVTSQLNNGATAVVYKNERIKEGHGKIYIEDKRGRGEYSRIVCINMLGNIKVVKGNQDCQ